MSRPSRLQRQVLSLYRELLRAGRGKPGAEARVRAEFRQHASLPRSDVLRIEYLYRRGRRQLQLLRSGHATALGEFVRPRGPAEESGAGAAGTQPDNVSGPRNPLDGMGSPETSPMDGDRTRSLPGSAGEPGARLTAGGDRGTCLMKREKS
ncbi:succinate dehydrogenase assembly factor 1, mitochondrial [Hyaena hyaena]|uniref:succinate dehydrogenase assembly factor 1, mitochondrial n=1 Tax=Hyaena hyaena TaxID=95912 RepID=UPI001922F877|nr:succinate dehydrogenase assembly factor 1, mitochondrial [Hyaena hyaena]